MCIDLTPDLVRDALAGVAAAQRRLIEKLAPEIHFSVAKMLRSWRKGPASGRDVRQEVEDMVQEVFLELFEDDGKALRRWDPDRLPLRGYVGYIARIRTAEVLRSRRSPWREEPNPAAELDRETPRGNPENEASSREELREVYLCLIRGFTADDGRIFDLLLVQEASPLEAAAVTGKSVDAIYQWRSRLYKRARKCRDRLSR